MEQIKKSSKAKVAAVLASIVYATSYSDYYRRDVDVSLDWAKAQLVERKATLHDKGDGVYVIYGTGSAIYLYTASAKAEMDRVAAEREATKLAKAQQERGIAQAIRADERAAEDVADAGKIRVSKIEVLWSELNGLDAVVWTSFAEANAALAEHAARRGERGGYSKTDFRVTWQNGETYEGRLDLCADHIGNTGIITDHVRSYLSRLAGRKPVPGLTLEESIRRIGASEEKREGAARFLDTYALCDVA